MVWNICLFLSHGRVEQMVPWVNGLLKTWGQLWGKVGRGISAKTCCSPTTSRRPSLSALHCGLHNELAGNIVIILVYHSLLHIQLLSLTPFSKNIHFLDFIYQSGIYGLNFEIHIHFYGRFIHIFSDISWGWGISCWELSIYPANYVAMNPLHLFFSMGTLRSYDSPSIQGVTLR